MSTEKVNVDDLKSEKLVRKLAGETLRLKIYQSNIDNIGNEMLYRVDELFLWDKLMTLSAIATKSVADAVARSPECLAEISDAADGVFFDQYPDAEVQCTQVAVSDEFELIEA